jgi:hypothetical protein
MSLRQVCCERQHPTDIQLFEMREIDEQIINSPAGCERFHHYANGHPHTADTGLPPITWESVVIRWNCCA